MKIYELVFLAIALAMDAFAVSICKGVSFKKSYIKTGVVCGIWFGFFQALMPFIGWLLGQTVIEYIEAFSPYIAFGLLAFLGIKMIKEAFESRNETCPCQEKQEDSSLGFKVMFVFAIATSIDALAAGLTLSAVNANIYIAILLIGVITFAFSFIGSIIGAKLGTKYQFKAELAGGIILILLGLKVLIEQIITYF